MGVTGLWRLIEPAGKPVPVETLENKVLAVDISIWLHQMVKGYQDAKGAPIPNAHLMGLLQRLCKLLYFRVKPVFVFDGGFPDLKRETIAKRQENKTKYHSESERIKRELALLLSKKTAIGSLLGKQIPPTHITAGTSKATDDDLFKLPALPPKEDSETESEDEESSSSSIVDMHSVDVDSDNFKNLPVKEKYDLLLELKDTRKMNSWGRLHELPKKSDNFSDFQMQRLLKRRKVQECLEETEKEMGDTGMSLNELESLLNEEGIDTKVEALPRRIASNNNTRFLLINNVKQALEDARKKKEMEKKLEEDKDKIPVESKLEEDKDKIPVETEPEIDNRKDELEDDLQRAIKMSLECVDDNDTSNYNSKTDDSWTSNLSDSDYQYESDEDDFEPPDMTSAKAYIMQYCDFTNTAINQIVSCKTNKNKPKGNKVDRIIEELNKEKSIIADEVELSDEENQEELDEIQEIQETKSDSEHVPPEVHEILKIKTESEDIPSDDETEITQASVMCIEPTQDIIALDTSTEIDDEMPIADKSESSDDEFEDVPDIEEPKKPIVELTLNMGELPGDDIFADVFKKNITNVKTDSNNKSRDITTEMTEKNKSAPNRPTIENIQNDTTEANTTVSQEPLVENILIEKNKKLDKAKIYDDNKVVVTEKNISIKESETSQIDIQDQDASCVEKSTNTADNNAKERNNTDSSKHIEAITPNLTSEQLNTMVMEMDNQEKGLIEEKGRLDRIGRNITEQMTKEAQELLQIFGIPYVVAPMEAEAQCAFLETVNLTDGTITDDSDIWLFGGKTVYKNFFNQKKHVAQFLSDRIEKSFNLTREQLILLALLVGSDYTMGLNGVGPVTALEILASFPFNKKQLISETSEQGRHQKIITGLQEFKKWVRAGKRTDNISLKKKLKNISVTDDFPSLRVVQAYLDPNVEKSREKFTWGELDITILRDYAKAKFGWSQNKLDEIIKPVLKRLQDQKSQKNINDYFKKKVEFQSLDEHLSKRVKAAVQRMDPDFPLEDATEKTAEPKTKTRRKRKTEKVQGNEAVQGSSQVKLKKSEESALEDLGVRVVSKIGEDGKSTIEIRIPKSDRVQEIIPQREKDKKSLLQNKMKAIEVFRKSKLDRKTKTTKRKVIIPKEKAELSESDSD